MAGDSVAESVAAWTNAENVTFATKAACLKVNRSKNLPTPEVFHEFSHFNFKDTVA